MNYLVTPYPIFIFFLMTLTLTDLSFFAMTQNTVPRTVVFTAHPATVISPTVTTIIYIYSSKNWPFLLILFGLKQRWGFVNEIESYSLTTFIALTVSLYYIYLWHCRIVRWCSFTLFEWFNLERLFELRNCRFHCGIWGKMKD